MKIDIPDESVPLIVRALETQYAYTRAKQADDPRYPDAADLFKRKPVGSETVEPAKKKRKA